MSKETTIDKHITYLMWLHFNIELRSFLVAIIS